MVGRNRIPSPGSAGSALEMGLDRCFRVSSFLTMGCLLGRESCQDAAQPSTGQRSGEAGWRPIHRLAVGHAGGSRGAAAFALHGASCCFRRLCSCEGAERADYFEKESEGSQAPGGGTVLGQFSMAFA